MAGIRTRRREFVKAFLSTAAISALPGSAIFAQTAVKQRLEWQAFVQSANYQSFLTAVNTMRANTNASDRNSWLYWTNSHVNYCPHGIAYFLAWHRGYLYHFERQLQIVSGNSTLSLPYWDYYKYPTMPAQFTDASPGNPLYVSSRAGSYVYDALTMDPFLGSVTNFQRGTSNAFEPTVENAPHNPVHNLIGGYMAGMQSPQDPIFWLHHANIDRLWAAWVAAGAGRKMPASNNKYWSGSFTYGPSLTLSRRETYNTTGLGYSYPDLALPSAFPPRAQAARIMRAQFSSGAISKPRGRSYTTTAPRAIGANRRSLGGVADVQLNEESFTVALPVEAANRQTVQAIAGAAGNLPFGGQASGPYRSVQIVLDNVRLTDVGQNGGYFYKVYVNLPPQGDASVLNESHLLGTIGPFEISGASHHGGPARISFPATRQLAATLRGQPQDIEVSIVRVSGRNAPKGIMIGIGEARVEVSDDEVE